jgi:hypothetical protein
LNVKFFIFLDATFKNRFPWESGFTGAEVTPDCCPETSENQQHITADIAYAARQYLALTNDLEWLLKASPTSNVSTNIHVY